MQVEWSKVLNKCTPSVRKGIMDLRSRHEDLRRLILETRSTMPKVDFDYYRSRLPASEHGMLGEMEARLKAFQPAKMEVASKLQELEAQKQAKMEEAAGFLNKLETEVVKLRSQLEKLRAAKPVDEMTVNDVYALNPQYKEQIYENIRKDNWATEDDKDAGLEAAESNKHH